MQFRGLCLFGFLVALFGSLPVRAAVEVDTEAAVGKSVTEVPDEAEKAEDKKPASIIFDYKTDAIAPVRGGVSQKPVMMGSLTLGAEFDLERLAHLKGSSIQASLLAIHGKSPSKAVGDIQSLSNLEGTQALSLYQAYWNQSFYKDRLSLLAGVHDISSEFYQTESSLTLINSTFAIGPEFSRSGVNGPSVYPITGLAAVVRARPIQSVRVHAGLYDGLPGDANGEPRGTHLKISKSKGYVAIGEANYDYEINAQQGMVGAGYWRYSKPQYLQSEFQPAPADLEDPEDAEDPVHSYSMSQGAYFLLNQKLYSEIEGLDLGLSSFIRAGVASSGPNPISESFAAGLSYLGFFPSRLEDTISLGVAVARTGTEYDAARTAEWKTTPH